MPPIKERVLGRFRKKIKRPNKNKSIKLICSENAKKDKTIITREMRGTIERTSLW
jgi:hypothetical protein